MGVKSWLFGKDRKSTSDNKQAEAIAGLKKKQNELEVQSRNLTRKSDEEKVAAKKMLKSGNKSGAKQALTRSSMHMKKYNQIQNMNLRISKQIDAIGDAQLAKDFSKAVKIGTQVIEETFAEISPADFERSMMESEEQMDRIEEMNEIMSDTSAFELDIDDEMMDSIDDQLATLEMEMNAESVGDLPEAGTATSTTPVSEKKGENADLADELKALKEELGDN